jgi:hypothetical protein
MKHIQTFESFLNEAVINESRVDNEIWPEYNGGMRRFSKFPKKGSKAEKAYYWHEDFMSAAMKSSPGTGRNEYEKQARNSYYEYIQHVKKNESI